MAEQVNVNKLEKQRQEKLERIRELGIDPYGSRIDGISSSAEVVGGFVDDKEGQQGSCAGRIVLLRDIGKLIFITLRDSSGTIQLGLSKKLLAKQWELCNLLELGDIIAAKGQLGRTRTGEITIWAESVSLLSKSLLQPPEKWHGLADVDLRYRQRYVDLWANPEVMERFKARIAILATMRGFLCERATSFRRSPSRKALKTPSTSGPICVSPRTWAVAVHSRDHRPIQ